MRVHVLGVVGAGAFWAGLASAQVVTGVQVTTGPTGTTTQTTTATGPAATSAQATATSAQLTAANAEVPGSGIAPTTTAGTGAGSEEGALLVAPETRLAAQYLTETVLNDKAGVLVFVGGSAVPDVSPWLYFEDQTTRLDADISAHKTALEQLLKISAPEMHTNLALLPLALILAPKILSYGYTSYSAAGANIAPDDYMLGVALLKYAPTWNLYAQLMGQTLPKPVSATLDKLDKESIAASSDVVVAQRQIAVLSKTNANDPNIASLTAASANVTGDLANYNAFLTSLNSTTSAASWSNVLQAYAFNNALDSTSGGGVAFIKVHSTAVGVLTKSNLWTNLGLEAPMYTSVGMVVSYVFYEKGMQTAANGQPLHLTPTSAGIFEIQTPYNKAESVTKTLIEDGLGHCKVTGPVAGYPDAATYCPIVYHDAQ